MTGSNIKLSSRLKRERIGWRQLHYDEPQWIREVIQETWEYQKTRWLARSETLHGKEIITSQATKDALLARIHALYSHEAHILVQDRHSFNKPLDKWPTRSANYMKQWLCVSSAPFIKGVLPSLLNCT
eukprot:scaffold33310_cov29-Attheya_sp.AAC.2